MTRTVVRRVYQRYQALSAHDQQVARRGGVAAGVLLMIAVVLSCQHAVQRAHTRVQAKRSDLAYLQSVLPEIRMAPPPRADGGESLVATVDRDIQQEGLADALRGTEPAGTGGLTVHLENADFGKVLNWLVRAQRQDNLIIKTMTLDKAAAAGHVSGSVTVAVR